MRPADCKIAYDGFCDCVRCVSRWQSNIPTHRQHLKPVKDFTEPWTCLPGPCAAPRTAAQRPCTMPKLSSYLQKERSDPQQQPTVSSVPVLETEWPSNHRGDAGRSGQQRNSCLRLWLPRHAGCCWCCFLGTASGCGAPTARQRSIPAADGAVQGAA